MPDGITLNWEWLNRPEQARLSNKHGSCLCTFYHNGKARVMIIDSVCVEEEHQNQGWGTKLMQDAILLARGASVESIELVVNEDNKIAIRLYEKLGFDRPKKLFYRKILQWKPSRT